MYFIEYIKHKEVKSFFLSKITPNSEILSNVLSELNHYPTSMK